MNSKKVIKATEIPPFLIFFSFLLFPFSWLVKLGNSSKFFTVQMNLWYNSLGKVYKYGDRAQQSLPKMYSIWVKQKPRKVSTFYWL